MDIQQNVPLSTHSTMRLGGPASYLTEVHNRSEVQEAVRWAKEHGLPVIMIGDGSNIVWSDKGFAGLVIVNKILGFERFEQDNENIYFTVGAGENWDSVVARIVSGGLTGVEALSFIPGTAGATPVQNVGAYGQEVSNALVSVEAFDTQKDIFVTIPNSDCAFGYRTSRFKTTDKGRFLITGITLHVRQGNPMPPFYKSVQAYLDQHKIHNFTPQAIRDAVIVIRASKLPDPKQVANNGSFFANPIIDRSQFNMLLDRFPGLSYWELPDDKYKLAAAWLVEQAGFKGVHDSETGMATWSNQALVLVNEHAHSTADLLKFKQKIVSKVQATFGITLQQEPEFIGTP